VAAVKSRTWYWRFDTPVESVWPVLADTARFNEAAALPRHAVEEVTQPDGSVNFLGHARIGPLRLSWQEKPANWIHAQWFEHCRYFLNGPLAFLCARLELTPEDRGCKCAYTVRAAPRNALGHLLMACGFFTRIERTFTPLMKNARDFARGARETRFDCARPPRLAVGARDRVPGIVEAIEATPHGHGLAKHLAEFVLTRQEVDVWAIRPLVLARQWEVPERHAIELCLEAVKQGLLGLRWDLLCPRCQVGKRSARTLDELPSGAHCGSCNIDYGRDYTSNIELAFHPARSIRPLEGGEYCLFGPMSTPHIKLHLTLAPGESRTVPMELPADHYRLRTLEPGAEHLVDYGGGGFPAVVVTAEGVEAGSPASPGEVILHNTSPRTLTLIVEHPQWRRDALTAKRATALQAFRDLFNDDVLRPGDDVEIDHIALMFTDLKGSTALYERIGDPRAYALVREHFAILGRCVREHDGAVVKTIGDAIMGAFADPRDALRCAIRIQDDFDAFNQRSGKEPVIIKLGLHVGRCISVTLNDRLDYYGSTANKAARLEGQSLGSDIIMSPEFIADPLVAAIAGDYPVERGEARLKGFDEPVHFYRISAATLEARRAQAQP